jgi:hypothetical protein
VAGATGGGNRALIAASLRCRLSHRYNEGGHVPTSDGHTYAPHALMPVPCQRRRSFAATPAPWRAHPRHPKETCQWAVPILIAAGAQVIATGAAALRARAGPAPAARPPTAPAGHLFRMDHAGPRPSAPALSPPTTRFRPPAPPHRPPHPPRPERAARVPHPAHPAMPHRVARRSISGAVAPSRPRGVSPPPVLRATTMIALIVMIDADPRQS